MRDDARRSRFEPWPLALAGLLAAMVGTGVGFWRLAKANPDALVVADAYRAGIAYGIDQHAIARARALGWQLDVRTRPAAAGVRVAVTLRDAAGRAVEDARVALRRERPAEGGLDVDVPLVRDAGTWRGEVELPRPGRWRLVARAERGDEALERAVAVFRPAR